jgi:hypothetical protein
MARRAGFARTEFGRSKRINSFGAAALIDRLMARREQGLRLFNSACRGPCPSEFRGKRFHAGLQSCGQCVPSLDREERLDFMNPRTHRSPVPFAVVIYLAKSLS